MITPTKRFPLSSSAKFMTEEDRYDACHNCNDGAQMDENWEATVRWREDDLIIAEQKVQKLGQELFAAKAQIARLKEDANIAV